MQHIFALSFLESFFIKEKKKDFLDLCCVSVWIVNQAYQSFFFIRPSKCENEKTTSNQMLDFWLLLSKKRSDQYVSAILGFFPFFSLREL